jgi:hypothetical protein
LNPLSVFSSKCRSLILWTLYGKVFRLATNGHEDIRQGVIYVVRLEWMRKSAYRKRDCCYDTVSPEGRKVRWRVLVNAMMNI